jgi:hypothetical protein
MGILGIMDLGVLNQHGNILRPGYFIKIPAAFWEERKVCKTCSKVGTPVNEFSMNWHSMFSV